MSPKMTDDQRKAVETLAGDLAISAGAGSGKTTVLAHRFAHALSKEATAAWAPAELDRILTITFTNKAAGEIAERARRVVNAEVSVAQGRRIDEAWISTIHTFCGRLIRRHVLESGVEPGFKLADEVATGLMMAEAFERAASELCGTDPGATALLETWDTATLRDAVTRVHANVRAMGLSPASVEVPDGLEYLEEMHSAVLEAGEAFAAAIAGCTQTAKVAEKAERLISWCETLARCALDDSDYCGRLLALEDAYDISHLPGATTDTHNAFKEARKALKSAVVAASHAEVLGGLQSLVRALARHYEVVKAEASSLDFDDLQERAVALLESHPDVAKRYRERFRLLMIDEFQDTNDLQMRVLSKIRNDNLCVVGDERQSIYGFRYANVEIFERTREEMGPGVRLRDNFRSHAGVLGFVNEAFSGKDLFGSDFMQLEAKRDGGWKLDWPAEQPRVECVLVGEEDTDIASARLVEADLIAERIAELLREPDVDHGDIAVLLRASTSAGVYADALERRGVPTLVTAGVGLFDALETEEVRQLLRAIAVPGDEEALIGVLAGRMVRLSDDALLALRMSEGYRSMWEALRATAEGEPDAPVLPSADAAAARHASEVLEWFGAQQGRLRLGVIVRRACEAFDFDLTLLAAGTPGIRAWANVLKLARAADAFEETNSRDVAAFVDHLGQRMEASSEKAASAEAGGEAVRIMTVHAAKGLEFPIVFVADLGVDKQRSPGPLLVMRGEAAGVPVALVGVRLPSDPYGFAATGLYSRIAAEEKARRLDEEKRCLYVACTRAKELLVISGACKLDTPAEEGSKLIDWIREATGEPDESGLACGMATRVGVRAVRAEPSEEPEVAPEVAPEQAAVFAGQPFEPAEERAHSLQPPQAVSFSALSLHEKCPLSYHAVYTLHLSKFRAPGPRTTEFGSAVHAVLQVAGPEGAPAEAVAAAVARYGLDSEDAVRLSAAVEGFIGSELGVRAYAGERVGREVPLRVPLGETALQGNIDLISWNGAGALVVDYKTGRAPEAGDSRRDASYLLQAQCYALAALEAGAETVEVAFCFVDHGCRAVSFEFSAEDVDALRGGLQARVKSIVDDEVTHLEDYDAGVCAQCPALGGICPVDAPAGA